MNIVVFCTRNGAATLPPMLESLRRVHGLRDGWQIVAVDNGSSDGSREILETAATDLPIRVVEGAGSAKNGGLNLALDLLGPSLERAELAVFTDDDIIAEPGWLQALLEGARAHPQADLFGGAVVPRWPASPPSWLHALDGVFDVLYARTHAIEGPCAAHHLYGPNMAIRASVLARGARFDPRIGPDASPAYRMGSETEMVQRLEREGLRAVMLPAARVEHQVRPGQMTEAFVMARARRHGLGQGALAARNGTSALPPASHLARLLASEFKSQMARLPPLRGRRVKALYGREWLRGFCAGYLDQRAEARRRPGHTAGPVRASSDA